MLRRRSIVLLLVALAACARRHAAAGPTPIPALAPVAVTTPLWTALVPPSRVVAPSSAAATRASAPSPSPAATFAAPSTLRVSATPETPAPTPAAAPFSVTLPYIVVTPRPVPPEQPQYTFTTIPPIPLEAPNASPRIIDIIMPTYTVRGGESVTGDVIASSNVASVEVRVANFAKSMDKIAPGVFTVTITVPRLPFFLRHRTYTLHVIARNARGDGVTRDVAVTVR